MVTIPILQKAMNIMLILNVTTTMQMMTNETVKKETNTFINTRHKVDSKLNDLRLSPLQSTTTERKTNTNKVEGMKILKLQQKITLNIGHSKTTSPPPNVEPRLDRLVCVYNVSSEFRPTKQRFHISDMNVENCTDLYYDFTPLDSFPIDNKMKDDFYWLYNNVEPTPRYATVNDHKLKSPSLVTFLTVAEVRRDRAEKQNITGRVRQGTRNGLTFKDLVKDKEALRRFSEVTVDTLRLWGFDGLAIRWPMDSSLGSLEYLLNTLRPTFSDFFSKRKGDKLGSLKVLQIAVILETASLDSLRRFDMHLISKLADQITIAIKLPEVGKVTTTQIVQPLFSMNTDDNNGAEQSKDSNGVSIEEALQTAFYSGVMRQKLNVAISLIGRKYKLLNSSNTEVGAAAKLLDTENDTYGQILFYESCNFQDDLISRSSSKDDSPYMNVNDQWYTFEDFKSLSQKIRYIKNRNVGGIALFSQSEDDSLGKYCGRGPFPATAHARVEGNFQNKRHPRSPWESFCNGGTAGNLMVSELTLGIFLAVAFVLN